MIKKKKIFLLDKSNSRINLNERNNFLKTELDLKKNSERVKETSMK